MTASRTMTAASRLVLTSAAAHRAMRNDATRLAALLAELKARNRALSERLPDAFDQTVKLIQHHHHMEDDLVFPLVGKRVSSFSHSIESLEEDHVDLGAAVARIVSRLRLVSGGPSGSPWGCRHERLMQDIDRFAAILCAHIDREEDVLFPALERLGDDEAHHLFTAVTKIGGVRAGGRPLSWIISNADGIERRELRRSLPRHLILMHDVVWSPRFARRMRHFYALDGHH